MMILSCVVVVLVACDAPAELSKNDPKNEIYGVGHSKMYRKCIKDIIL